jgi:phosphatidate cytidylyltransferase
MMLVVSTFCVKEYAALCAKYKVNTVISVVLAFLFFCALYAGLPVYSQSGMVITIFAVLTAFVLFFIEILKGGPEGAVSRIAVSFFGTFFIPLALIHMVYIRNLQAGMQLVIFLFIVVWTLDTGAYAVGRMIGKHKLSPGISPKKTIEGAIAGVVTGVVVALLCRVIFMQNILTVKQTVILAVIISVVGQFSDLAESLIKRDANIKDSGNIIPGHGGMFDRFDSYLFAAPVMYYVMLFFSHG